MIRVLIGNLLDSSAQTLVNTVNCVGVMGKGIALNFKQRFPEMFKDYVQRCDHGEVRLGEPYIYRPGDPPWIINFPTKDHWRDVTKLDDIIRGLEHLEANYKEWGVTSIAVPPLGCGNGQLEWRVVGSTLHRYLSRLDMPVELYAPHGTPHEELLPAFLGQPQSNGQLALLSMPEPKWILPAWLAIVEVMHRIEQEPYHWPIGRTMLQKIAYVVTREGLPTNLDFGRGSYGPFSKKLKQLESRLANNGLIRASRQGNRQAIETGPTFVDAKKAYLGSIEEWDEVIERTVDLFMRVNTTQAEIMATVLFAADDLGASVGKRPTEQMVFDEVKEWKKRRKPAFRDEDVAASIRNLAVLGWLNLEPSYELPLPSNEPVVA